jgi:chaperonin GroES
MTSRPPDRIAEEKTKGGSSFPTPPRKGRRKARFSPLAPARERAAGFSRSTSRPATASCSADGGNRDQLDGEELLIMKESDVMGVIEGAAAPAKKAA